MEDLAAELFGADDDDDDDDDTSAYHFTTNPVETGNGMGNTEGGGNVPGTSFVQRGVRIATPEEDEAAGAARDDVPDDRFEDIADYDDDNYACQLISLCRRLQRSSRRSRICCF